MTSRPSDEAERAAAIASLQRTQVLLRETFASGDVPVDEEIRVRTQIADVLVSSCDQLQHQPFVHDAIHHLETVLRRASYVSGKYPMYLTSLSKARTSEYMMTGSSRALDLAVESGRQALELAVENDLQSLDFEAQIDIVSSLGFALSRRHALSEKLDDLDEAIVYTRMVYDGATKGSDRYIMGLNDLVSQLHRRIEQAHDDDLEQEAERLANELAASTTPGTLQHSIAVGQLGFIESKKFKATNSLDHLDQSLKYYKTAFEALPQHHETRLDILNMIIDLYNARRGRLKDVTDLGILVHYSGLLLEALPIGHPSRGSHLLGHIQRVQEYATEHTLSETGTNEEYAASMLDKTPLKPKLTSIRAARENPLGPLSPLQDMTIKEQILRTFGIYKDLVRSYSQRELSYKSDVVNGFAGVFFVLEHHFKGEIYSGLPAAAFAHALLWAPAGRLPRRGMRLPTPADFSLGSLKKLMG
ncbi:putative HET-domain-containing protein [Seiridium unicorne]|uniref:HET-domain-containing protein n=1 Tax=Seiridium unicorne TaxID=138068 RepID=A0ABR2UID5_9PEZI